MTKLSIIIPVYNEIKTIEKLIKKVLKLNISTQIIVVDDASNDGSKKVIKKFKNKLDKIIIHKKNLGKGAAIKSGQKYVKGKYVGIQDADLEYDPQDLKKLVKLLEKKKIQVVYGSRVLKKNKFKNTQNFTHVVRIWGNIFLTKVTNYINKQKLTDAHTCYKVLDSSIFKKIKLEENTPLDIKKVAREMYLRINNKWISTNDDIELQKNFWSMFDPSNYNSEELLIGADYLRDNRDLLL